MIKRIRISGIGGQGIVFSGWLLGYAATLEGLYSSVHNQYGSEVRGGTVISSIVVSDKPIENPYVDVFDMYLILHDFGWRSIVNYRGSEIIIADREIAYSSKALNYNVDWYYISYEAFKNKLPINMIALGVLAKYNVISLDSLKEAIKSRGRRVEENIKAVEIGFRLSKVV